MFRDTLPWEDGTGVNDGDASGQMYSICDGSLEKTGVGGEGGDRVTFNKRIRSRGRAERLICVVLGSDVLLGDFCQLVVIVWNIEACSIALKGRY